MILVYRSFHSHTRTPDAFEQIPKGLIHYPLQKNKHKLKNTANITRDFIEIALFLDFL